MQARGLPLTGSYGGSLGVCMPTGFGSRLNSFGCKWCGATDGYIMLILRYWTKCMAWILMHDSYGANGPEVSAALSFRTSNPSLLACSSSATTSVWRLVARAFSCSACTRVRSSSRLDTASYSGNCSIAVSEVITIHAATASRPHHLDQQLTLELLHVGLLRHARALVPKLRVLHLQDRIAFL
jgi:hypothetical protein